MRVENKTQWLHTSSTPEVILQHIHQKRGKEDAGEILPSFSGIMMHIILKSYNAYTACHHILCNTHLLWNLQGIIDSMGQKWTQQLQRFLTQALKLKKQYKGSLLKIYGVASSNILITFLEHPDISFDNNHAALEI